MLHLTSSPLFQIRLEDDTLTMRGLQYESVGCVLRGQLVLSITEPTKFKEIKLTFQGKSKISWTDGVGSGVFYHSEERILFQHDWVFLPAGKQCTVLQPNNYHWDFELILPGTLPETIENCERGSVSYKFKAVAERPGLALNLQTQRKVILQRSLLPSSFEFVQNMVVANTWTDRVDYEISVDSKVFNHGDTIPINISLRPIQPGLRVNQVVCSLKEYVTCTVGTYKNTESKLIRIIRDNEFPCEGETWNHTMEMTIPNVSLCLYDSRNEMIRINHRLKFFIIFHNDDTGKFSELIASIPIIISPDDNCMDLPAYDEHYVDKSCSEDFPLNYFSSSLSSPSTTSLDDSLIIEDFRIEDLNRLPSYRSISSCIPAPLADSLPPTYDACISGH